MKIKILFVISLFIVQGCAGMRYMKGDETNLSYLRIGESRNLIIDEYGEPESSIVNKDGYRVDKLMVDKGVKKSKGKGIFYVVASPLSLFASETYEHSDGKLMYTITYGEDDKIYDISAEPIVRSSSRGGYVGNSGYQSPSTYKSSGRYGR